MKKISPLILISLVIGCVQTSSGQGTEINPVKKRFADSEADPLKEAYQGIFTENGKIHDLFPIYSTGVSTKPIITAAVEFLGSLTSDQLNRTTFEIEDEEWRKWNEIQVLAHGKEIEIKIIGITTIKFIENSDVSKKGSICLQAHEGEPYEVHYKDISIRKID